MDKIKRQVQKLVNLAFSSGVAYERESWGEDHSNLMAQRDDLQDELLAAIEAMITPPEHVHDWWVVGRADGMSIDGNAQERHLIVECSSDRCGAIGTVDDPSRSEWLLYGSIGPYRLQCPARVEIAKAGVTL